MRELVVMVNVLDKSLGGVFHELIAVEGGATNFFQHGIGRDEIQISNI